MQEIYDDRCTHCGNEVQVRKERGIATVFCSPEHAHAWQAPRSEAQILAETGIPGNPYDRCQWCKCTLKGGWHDKTCPVRAVAVTARAAAGGA